MVLMSIMTNGVYAQSTSKTNETEMSAALDSIMDREMVLVMNAVEKQAITAMLMKRMDCPLSYRQKDQLKQLLRNPYYIDGFICRDGEIISSAMEGDFYVVYISRKGQVLSLTYIVTRNGQIFGRRDIRLN